MSKQTKIYIGLDEDALSKSMKIISLLLEYGLEVYKIDTSEIEDIGSVTQTEAEDLKSEASKINLESIFELDFPQFAVGFPRPNPHGINNASVFFLKQDFNINVDFS